MKNITSEERTTAAALGARIGDALAMPAHWYYNTKALKDQFSTLDSYKNPPKHHPDSILWRSQYPLTQEGFDILGDQRVYWGQRHVHYHQFLQAGQNTLNIYLLRKVLEQVTRDQGYDRATWIQTYLAVLRNPQEHQDTYIEECHRGFFVNLARGKTPEKCAVVEKHIGGMVGVIPLYAALRHLGKDHWFAAEQVLAHVALTHGGAEIKKAATSLLTLAAELWQGADLEEILQNHLKKQDLAYLQGPLVRMAEQPPDEVFGRQLSTACYLDHSLPGVAYLALRYPQDPRTGLVANTMAGGDNCGRGAVLGALYGLAYGIETFPQDWVDGLDPKNHV
ncbi:MAG: ADP-ribosylglycohydrolase family protein [Spirochaetales bacterium]|nr:ADP-ribosylglycohydrolase family protein [Spirochaetales bacterium]